MNKDVQLIVQYVPINRRGTKWRNVFYRDQLKFFYFLSFFLSLTPNNRKFPLLSESASSMFAENSP